MPSIDLSSPMPFPAAIEAVETDERRWPPGRCLAFIAAAALLCWLPILGAAFFLH